MLPKGYGGRSGAGVNHSETMEPQPRAQGLRRAALAALGAVVVVVNWLVADWSVAHAARPWPSPAAMHTLVFVLLTLAFLIFISRRERKG